MPPKETDEAQAELLVVELMERNNRPYNAQMVTDHTAGRVRKVLAQNVLEKLLGTGRLAVKDFGKNRVYFPDQTRLAS